MTTFILDTSIVTLLQYNHAVATANLIAHNNDTVVIPTIAAEEAFDGCFDLLRRARTNREKANAHRIIGKVISHVGSFGIIPPTVAALDRFDQLVRLKLNVGNNDLRIAAIALEIDAVVVTVNVRDFSRVPGLKWEDWSR